VGDCLGFIELEPGTTLVVDSSGHLACRDDDPRCGIGFPATQSRLQLVGTTPVGTAPLGTVPATGRLANATGTLDGVDLTLSGAALSRLLVCDLQRSSDGGQTWQSLWISDQCRPTIQPGLTSGSLAGNRAISFNTTDQLVLGLSATSPGSGTVTGTVWIRIALTP
jgi:hypothetical protein